MKLNFPLILAGLVRRIFIVVGDDLLRLLRLFRLRNGWKMYGYVWMRLTFSDIWLSSRDEGREARDSLFLERAELFREATFDPPDDLPPLGLSLVSFSPIEVVEFSADVSHTGVARALLFAELAREETLLVTLLSTSVGDFAPLSPEADFSEREEVRLTVFKSESAGSTCFSALDINKLFPY